MQFNQFSFSKCKQKLNVLRTSSALILLWLFLLASSALWTIGWLMFGNTANAVGGIHVVNGLTFGRVPDVVIAKSGLELLATAQTIAIQVTDLQSSLIDGSDISIQPIIPKLQNFEQQLELFQESWNRKGPSILKPYTTYKLESLTPGLTPTKLLATSLKYISVLNASLEKPGDYVVLFQNADEIRATGGFLGSYARFTYYDGIISAPVIRDIYEPAGQFTGFIPAPPGVQEYLSGGNGLQLQDANWAADFPTAAKSILSFFSLGNEQNISGVIAIHSGLISDVLAITGPLYLPDYDAFASAENFSDLARADREKFFPGSKQKTFFLEHFFTQLKLALGTASTQQVVKILTLLVQEHQSYILAYHDQPLIQQKIEIASFSGSIQIPQNTELFLYPVESNVGINKANKGVSRTYRLTISENESSLRITFDNKNSSKPRTTIRNPNVAEADHLHYMNYQRLLVEPDINVTGITQGDTTISDWSEEIITTDGGLQLKEIGFLVVIRENTTSHITISLAHPGKISSTTQVTMPFQPGLSSTILQIETAKDVQQHTFNSDVTAVIPL